MGLVSFALKEVAEREELNPFFFSKVDLLELVRSSVQQVFVG